MGTADSGPADTEDIGMNCPALDRIPEAEHCRLLVMGTAVDLTSGAAQSLVGTMSAVG